MLIPAPEPIFTSKPLPSCEPLASELVRFMHDGRNRVTYLVRATLRLRSFFCLAMMPVPVNIINKEYDVFSMKLFFAPDGWKFGDFDLIEKDGQLYCIFIKRAKTDELKKAEHGNSYGLAKSEDGIHWTFEGEVKTTHEGKWDGGSLLAQCVFRYQDKFAMLYSAVSETDGDHHPFQQFGLSFSDDLKTWTDHEGNPIITNDSTGEFYHPKGLNKFAWRDPAVYNIDDTFHCIFAAKDKGVEYEKSACVAHFTSENLIDWHAQPPLFTPGNIWELETPHIYDIEQKDFLVFGTYPFGQPEQGVLMRYAISDNFLGPFSEPKNNSLAPTMCFAERMIRYRDNLVLYHWIRDKHQGKLETYLAPPKLVERQGDHLLLKKHPEIDDLFPLSEEEDKMGALSRAPDKRLRFSRHMHCEAFTLQLRCRDPRYSKDVSFAKGTGTLIVRDISVESNIHDERTLPLALEESCSVELFFEGRFLEIYIDGYFVYAVMMETSIENIEKLEFV